MADGAETIPQRTRLDARENEDRGADGSAAQEREGREGGEGGKEGGTNGGERCQQVGRRITSRRAENARRIRVSNTRTNRISEIQKRNYQFFNWSGLVGVLSPIKRMGDNPSRTHIHGIHP